MNLLRLFKIGLVIIVCMAVPEFTFAQNVIIEDHSLWCGTCEQEEGISSSIPRIETSGDVRSIVVLARFKDDMTQDVKQWNDTCSSPPCTELPDFANHIISPVNRTIDGFHPKTVTQYFYEQSEPGNRLVFYGEVYPEVYISKENEEVYTILDSSKGRGFARLTKEILDHLDDDPNFDFSDFDRNDDGYVDYITIIIRNTPYYTANEPSCVGYSGISDLVGYCTTPGVLNGLNYDGKHIDWRRGTIMLHNKSGNLENDDLGITPNRYYQRLWAHEVGHDIWGPHIASLRENGTPVGPDSLGDNDSGEKIEIPLGNRVAFALMSGSGAARPVIPWNVISAYEREQIGWLDCDELVVSEQAIELNDLATADDCYKITLNSSTNRVMHLANLQRETYYTEKEIWYSSSNPSFYSIEGLPVIGLLPTITRGGSWGRYTELQPNNLLPHKNEDGEDAVLLGQYDDILFGYEHSRQITPWTRPNISGCFDNVNCDSGVMNWMAIDNIGYVSGDSGTMQFDFISDFRDAPVIRKDSWIGMETSGTTFSENIIVEAGYTLTIEEGVELNFEPNRGILVYGELKIEGTESDPVILSSSGSNDLWNGLYFAAGSSGNLNHVKIESTGSNLAAVHVNSGGHVVINNSNITNESPNIFTLVYGVYASGVDTYVNINNSVIKSLSSNALRASNYGTIQLSGTTVRIESSNQPLLVALNSGVIRQYVYHQDNIYWGGRTLAIADGEALFWRKTNPLNPVYPQNEFCDEESSIFEVNTGGYIRSQGNYFFNQSGPTEINNGGTINVTNILGASDCPSFGSIPNDDFIVAADEQQSYISGESFINHKIRSFLRRNFKENKVSDLEKFHLSIPEDVSGYDNYIIGYSIAYEEFNVAYNNINEVLSKNTDPQMFVKRKLNLIDLLVRNNQMDYALSEYEQLVRFVENNIKLLPDFVEEEMNFLRVVMKNERNIPAGKGDIAVGKKNQVINTANEDEVTIQNYPNPFNPVTTIRYNLPYATDVKLDIYNVQGQRVYTLQNGFQPSGTHTAVFDASGLASGIYIYRLDIGNGSNIITNKMLLIK